LTAAPDAVATFVPVAPADAWLTVAADDASSVVPSTFPLGRDSRATIDYARRFPLHPRRSSVGTLSASTSVR
jgi:hypothetical protein